MVVVGWGDVAGNPMFAYRAEEVGELLQGTGKQLYCFEKNADGSTKHPAWGRSNLHEWP